ncbi:MAG: hypothetical protein KF893_18675 [Caldilineaceae bacterium]|nr:hypothetical protein [Caldilineaceae bacterium]
MPSDQPTPGILLAWRTSITDTTTIEFELSRSQFTSADSDTFFPAVPVPALQDKTIAEDGSELRYTVIDTQVEDGIKYNYVLTVTKTISDTATITDRDTITSTVLAVETHTWVYDNDPETAPRNDEICLSTSSRPTWTPTPTYTGHPTDTPLPPTPTHTATPTWTPTPTNTQPPSPIVWPTDTPYPSPTFTPLPTDTPIPPTATETPTETPSPTLTPAVSAPTPRFDANTGFNSQWTDPNSSILPTPDWNLPQENQPIWPEETPTPNFSFDALSQEAFMAENVNDPQEAFPAQAALMAAVENETASNNEEENEAVALLAPAEPESLPVLSEYRSAPARDGSTALRLALYTVGALALLSALAFLVGAVAIFGSRPRS